MFTSHVAKQLTKPARNLIYTSSEAHLNVARDFLDIPTPLSLPLIGTRLAIWKAGSARKWHEYIDKRHKELGPIFREQLGPVQGTFVADPDSIRSIFFQEGKCPVHIIPQPWLKFNKKYKYSRGLLFMDESEWLEHRTIMNKLLMKGDLNWMEDCCNLVIGDFINQLKNIVSYPEVENLEEKLYRTFIDVLVCVLLGSESYGKHVKSIEPLMKHLPNDIKSVFETTVKLQMFPDHWIFELSPQWKQFEMSMKKALDGTYSLVDELSKICDDSNSLLMKMRKTNLSDDRIKAIVADLVLAAADTTAYTMQWMLYMVAKNEDVQIKIRSELSNPASTYTKNVLRETLRLYPVAPFITRFLPHESVIAGYKIPQQSLIIMSIYSTGRDERYFKNAAKFSPERWERGKDKQSTMQASLPFAAGARSCVGRKLAEFELQNMLTEMVKNFSLTLCNDKSEIPVVLKLIAVPSEPIRLKLEKLY